MIVSQRAADRALRRAAQHAGDDWRAAVYRETACHATYRPRGQGAVDPPCVSVNGRSWFDVEWASANESEES